IARPYLLTFASLVAISRVFVGVHYPGDIIVGSAIGALIGLALAVIFARVYATWLKGKEKRVDHAV
ncbi:MAG: phosphatase PAP2 family protein, partial [candidate division Zixibacteria bacterium]|nr:phosphatase PAP2 family protein [candidate division Zixibacteria bacterium]